MFCICWRARELEVTVGPTDLLRTGVSFIVCVWKLKGPSAAPPGIIRGVFEPSLNVGLVKLAGELEVDRIEPKRVGKVSVMGEREFGSKLKVESTVPPTPPIPSPAPSCISSPGMGVGGVGVRGGSGTGRLDAIAVVDGGLDLT